MPQYLSKVGDKVHVSDLKVPEGVEIKTDPDLVIAAVEMPKDQVAEADAALAETQEQEGAAEESEEAADAEAGEEPADDKTSDKAEEE